MKFFTRFNLINGLVEFKDEPDWTGFFGIIGKILICSYDFLWENRYVVAFVRKFSIEIELKRTVYLYII
jgi:hypothetical protein